MLHNPMPTIQGRRIFTYGDAGTKKTASGLDIALWGQRSGSDMKLYVIDTDFAIDNIMVEAKPYTGLANVICTVCRTFDEVEATTGRYLALLRPHDWLMVDIMSETWGYVQTRHIEEIYSKTKAEHMEDRRKIAQDNVKGGQMPVSVPTMSPLGDWPTVNARYFEWRDRILKGNKFNVYCTAHQKELERQDRFSPVKETEHTLTYYGRIGYKPDGQKGIDGLMDTVIYMRYDGDNWYMTSIKDRFREKMRDVPLNDFVLSYLVPYGGFKLT